MKLPLITFTGIDQWTNMDELKSICEYSSNVEIGILVTDTPDNRPRYPSEIWIGLTIGKYYSDIRFALHVCGSGARKKLKSGYYDLWLDHVRRVQINGMVSPDELMSICHNRSQNKFITQHNETNKLLAGFDFRVNNGVYDEITHSLLVDASGGRGVMPSEWIMPATTKRVGFAGGLGPNEMTENLPKIVKAANGTDFWIDMEGKIRTDDKFDINKVRQVLNEIDRIPSKD